MRPWGWEDAYGEADLDLRAVSTHAHREIFRASASARQLREGLLHDAILQGVERNDDDTSAGAKKIYSGTDRRRDHVELGVDLNANCLKLMII